VNKRPVALGLILALSVSHIALAADALRDGFKTPPAEARPQVFWQWINGNVTQEGVHLDLEWMKRAGIGGSILFDIGFGSPPIPQYVDKRVGYGSPEWKAAVRYAAAESKRLGLQFGMQAGGGWSESGGPWVKPEEAMKKLVWSETVVSGRDRCRWPRRPASAARSRTCRSARASPSRSSIATWPWWLGARREAPAAFLRLVQRWNRPGRSPRRRRLCRAGGREAGRGGLDHPALRPAGRRPRRDGGCRWRDPDGRGRGQRRWPELPRAGHAAGRGPPRPAGPHLRLPQDPRPHLPPAIGRPTPSRRPSPSSPSTPTPASIASRRRPAGAC
jgi:hypothetical protein